jgi:hypothetical protein
MGDTGWRTLYLCATPGRRFVVRPTAQANERHSHMTDTPE